MALPDQLLEQFDAGAKGFSDVDDMREILHAIIADVMDSVVLAMTREGIAPEVIVTVEGTVQDYIANHYGDD